MVSTTNQKSRLSEYLLNIKDEIFSKFELHPIILSLSNATNKITKEKLINIRNDFLIQDYFFLTDGYCEAKRCMNIRSCVDWLTVNSDPEESESVCFIRREIIKYGLSLVNKQPNKTTTNYINFCIETAKSSEIEFFSAKLACISIYLLIGTILLKNKNHFFYDSETRNWIGTFTTPRLKEQLLETCDTLDQLAVDLNIVKYNKMEEIYIKACYLEYEFFDSLL